MSYNKNTLNESSLDKVSYMLQKYFPEEVKIEVLGFVNGYGLNDDYDGIGKYPIRKLTFRDTVILEQMLRIRDCDFDDGIFSTEFDADNVPSNWPLEIYIDGTLCEEQQ